MVRGAQSELFGQVVDQAADGRVVERDGRRKRHAHAALQTVLQFDRRERVHSQLGEVLRQLDRVGGVPLGILEDVALHYFGGFNNTIAFPEVRLPNVGSIDYVLVRHKPMKPEVEDFVSVEFQSDSTTSTGELIEGILDFFQGRDVQEQTYKFGMNTYDSIKRAITQLMNKGIVYETWDTKCYWVVQEYIYANLVNRYGFKTDGFSSRHASRFALYDSVRQDNRLALIPTRFISSTVDEGYQAMRNNPGLPNKGQFA